MVQIPILVNIVCLVVFLPCSTATAAQPLTIPDARQGYYLSAAVQGVAVSSRDYDLGRLETSAGPGLSVSAGQMVTDWLGIGLRLEGGAAQGKRWQQSYGSLSVAAQTVPWRNLSIHFGAGLGFVQAADIKKKVDESLGVTGPCYTAALGYDFFPFHHSGSGGLGITPVVQGKYFPGDAFNVTMLWFGIETAWWSGLPKRELELPPQEAFLASE